MNLTPLDETKGLRGVKKKDQERSPKALCAEVENIFLGSVVPLLHLSIPGENSDFKPEPSLYIWKKKPLFLCKNYIHNDQLFAKLHLTTFPEIEPQIEYHKILTSV